MLSAISSIHNISVKVFIGDQPLHKDKMAETDIRTIDSNGNTVVTSSEGLSYTIVNNRTATGVPLPSTTTTSGSGTSPGTGIPSQATGGTPPNPRVRDVSFIKTKLMQPALTSHYEVYINPPPEAKSFIDKSGFPFDMTDLLLISCSDASLPGSSLTTHELNNDFTGVTQRHAYRRLYDDRVDFTFYVNSTSRPGQGYDQIRYFEAWMRYISGEQIANSDDITNFYRIKYPKQYKSPFISITKFERDLGSGRTSGRMVYKFINAFPISVGSMPVSYDSSQLLKVSVSFTYDRYVAGNIAQNQVEQEPTQTPATGVSISNGQFQENPNFTNPKFGTSDIQTTPGLGLNPGQINPGSGGLVV
jgi:hypothetical protein